jgi:hypothetical protein
MKSAYSAASPRCGRKTKERLFVPNQNIHRYRAKGKLEGFDHYRCNEAMHNTFDDPFGSVSLQDARFSSIVRNHRRRYDFMPSPSALPDSPEVQNLLHWGLGGRRPDPAPRLDGSKPHALHGCFLSCRDANVALCMQWKPLSGFAAPAGPQLCQRTERSRGTDDAEEPACQQRD